MDLDYPVAFVSLNFASPGFHAADLAAISAQFPLENQIFGAMIRQALQGHCPRRRPYSRAPSRQPRPRRRFKHQVKMRLGDSIMPENDVFQFRHLHVHAVALAGLSSPARGGAT
jgi:hypothetical protein